MKRLSDAIAGMSPAFKSSPFTSGASAGRRLMAALSDSTPAFTGELPSSAETPAAPAVPRYVIGTRAGRDVGSEYERHPYFKAAFSILLPVIGVTGAMIGILWSLTDRHELVSYLSLGVATGARFLAVFTVRVRGHYRDGKYVRSYTRRDQ